MRDQKNTGERGPSLPRLISQPLPRLSLVGFRPGEGAGFLNMTADQITIDRLADIRSLVAIAHETVLRLELDSRSGNIDPTEAAAILNETIANLDTAFQ